VDATIVLISIKSNAMMAADAAPGYYKIRTLDANLSSLNFIV
jgi:hypothetical protein